MTANLDGTADNDQHAARAGVEPVRRFTLAAALIVLSVVLGVLLIWKTSSSLLIIFAGVLFASFLDACARALGPIIPIGHAWRLTLVILILTALIVLGGIWGVGKLPGQARLLIRVMDTQLDVLQQYLLSFGVELFGPDGGRDFSRWFPEHDKLFGHAQTAVGTASSFLANTLVIVFLGLLFAFDPRAYRDSVVLLVRPSSRERVRAVLDEMGSVLRLWLVGQLIRIVLMTACVWLALYLLGLPGPFLARLAGRRVEFRALSRSDSGCDPGRFGSYASRSLDADLGRRDLHRHTIHRGLRDRTSDPASGSGAAAGMGVGGHRFVRFLVRRIGHCTGDALVRNRPCRCPTILY